MEPKKIYRTHKSEVPEGEHVVPLGKGRVVRDGHDCTVVAWGAMVEVCEKAADELAKRGRRIEIVDPRTLVPLDEAVILESVKKTGRLVVVYEAPRTSGFGGEIAAIVAEKAIQWLEGPIVRVSGFDTPFPYALEGIYMPDVRRVVRGVDKTFEF
jgi:pyruvate/2-oxoglutarate/acetoin dehydrogenase E1 component